MKLAALMAIACVAASRASAQDAPVSYPEFRIDGINGRGNTLQAGAGAVIPAGIYVRVSLDAAAGTTWRDGAAHASGRADVIARFTLDPLRESPIGFSLGGGVSVPVVEGDRVRPYATVVLDVEGRMHAKWTPAIQVGLGGGARVGVAIRRSAPRWR
jgi:hypothetical protein